VLTGKQFIVSILSYHTSSTILKNRQDACSTTDEFSCGVGF